MPGQSRGFVLVATLWILAAITIGAAYFAERVDQSRALAQQTRSIADASVELASTRAEILFRLATTEFSIYGLGLKPEQAIALDDRPYRGTGEDTVSLQDYHGLLNLNFVDKEALFHLLGQFGVPPEKRDPMLDTLLDYIDTDDLRRLNGAEKREYEAQGLAPPANDWLVAPGQLQGILGWREQTRLWRGSRFAQFVTTGLVPGLNLNTAPLEVLASLPGNTGASATLILQSRRLAPCRSAVQFARLTGNPALDNYTCFPGVSMRVTQRSKKMPWMIQYGVTLTPESTIAPWRIDYYEKSALIALTGEAEKNSPALPERDTQSKSLAEAI